MDPNFCLAMWDGEEYGMSTPFKNVISCFENASNDHLILFRWVTTGGDNE